MIAAAACSWTWWVGRISMSSSPAAVRVARNSSSVRAPALQPVQAATSALVCSSMSRSAITSETQAGRRAQHAHGFGNRSGILAREADHAAGDNDVDALAGERHGLEVAGDEPGVDSAGLLGVAPSEFEHLVGHVEPDGPTAGCDTPGADQDVGARGGAGSRTVPTRFEVGDRCRHAAAGRSGHRAARVLGVAVVVEAPRTPRRRGHP